MKAILFNLVSLLCFLFVGCTSVGSQRSGSAPEMDRQAQQTPEELARARAKAAVELAAGYFQRGQFAVALEELETAVKVQPNYAAAWGLYGLVYHAIKEDDKADASFTRALGLTPDAPEIRTNYGWFLCRTSREAASVAEFERAAANPLYRTPELALLYGGQCAGRAGKMQIAEQFFKRVLGIVPDSPGAYFGLAEVTYRLGRYQDAREHVRSSLQSPQVPAHVLAIGACVEGRLGDRAAASSYIAQLKNRFPKAVETARALNDDCD